MREITNKELENIVLKQPSAFLCGNGFSINFDNDFTNIYDRLYEAHKLLLQSGKYDVKANHLFKKVFEDNYKNVCKYVYTYKQKNIEEVFLSGIDFAESIIKDEDLIRKLNDMGYIHKLVFGKSELDLVESISRVGKKRGYKFVNIEYWSILIYMFFAINKMDSEKYAFPSNNEFITLIKVGYINKNKIVAETDDIHQFALSNGFNTYYRMLFVTAILCNGKAVNFSKLSNLSNLKLDKIKSFLDNFKVILTLNYDHILENMSMRPVQHIHGQYVLNEKEYVYYQSLGVGLNLETYVSFSDILIGDYFTNKTFAGMVNVMNKNPINKRTDNIVRIVGNCMKKDKVEVVVIFGMNIDNDQHIIRDVMLRFSDMPSKNVKIIYCYFTEADRDTFNEQYESSITFRKDVSYRVKETELLYIRTQDILKEYFNQLKALGIRVIFEGNSIDTANTDSDLMVAVMESIAQAENESRSENIRMGIKYRAAAGTSKLYDRKCYGYKHDEDGHLVIDEEKAKNVKLIFDLYLNGQSVVGIIKELERQKILSPTGKAK